jgi:hypothetical protein
MPCCGKAITPPPRSRTCGRDHRAQAVAHLRGLVRRHLPRLLAHRHRALLTLLRQIARLRQPLARRRAAFLAGQRHTHGHTQQPNRHTCHNANDLRFVHACLAFLSVSTVSMVVVVRI